MPELPEIEVTCAGISRFITENTIVSMEAYSTNLRWPISKELLEVLEGQAIKSVARRGKYILIHINPGTILIHLGMTGKLRILKHYIKPEKHDHFDLFFQDGIVLRMNDVRRFGSIFWAGSDPESHKLLTNLGPEPLDKSFHGEYLYLKSRLHKVAVKLFIMNQNVVAGIGNIYANEALFYAGIQPSTPVGKLSKIRCNKLVNAIKTVLINSIEAGGTMLDIRDGTEKMGYFHQFLMVYNQAGKPCRKCGSTIQYQRIGQRSMFFCKNCQH